MMLSPLQKILTESPSYIDSVNSLPLNGTKNKWYLDHLKTFPITKLGEYEGQDILLSGSIIFVEKDVRLVFYCAIENAAIHPLGLLSVKQTTLWKEKGVLQGLADYVFWNYVFPSRNSMVSDRVQTLDGKNFWKKQIKKALIDKLFCYVVNERNGSIQPLVDCNLIDDLYGEDKMHLRLVISKVKLSESLVELTNLFLSQTF